MKKPSIISLILILLLGFQLNAQDIVGELIAKTWTGQGELMGNNATFEMQWSHALDGRFVQLEFKNEMTLKNGNTIVFKSHAFYKFNNDKTIEGMWFDSRGIYFPLKGTFNDTEIQINWGSPEIEQGKTIYTLSGETIQVKDFVLKEGEYVHFGNATYN